MPRKKKPQEFSFAEHAAAKQRAREEDDRRLREGEVTVDQLQRENSMFSAFGPGALRRARITFPEKE